MAIKRAEFPLPDVEDELTAEFFAGAARGELVIPRCDVRRAGSGIRSRRVRAAAAALGVDGDRGAGACSRGRSCSGRSCRRSPRWCRS